MKKNRASKKDDPNIPKRNERPAEKLGDFTASLRLLPICALAIVMALALLRLIGLFTNLFYVGRWSTAMVSPVGIYLGFYAVFVPMIGALVIAAMARYGSERIRGHGIPETIEAILISGRRVEPILQALRDRDLVKGAARTKLKLTAEGKGELAKLQADPAVARALPAPDAVAPVRSHAAGRQGAPCAR